MGAQPGVCTMAPTCGHAGVMEFNGDVYSCDHFVFPEFKLGNIYEKSLIEMMYSEKQIQFGQQKEIPYLTNVRNATTYLPATGNVLKTDS